MENRSGASEAKASPGRAANVAVQTATYKANLRDRSALFISNALPWAPLMWRAGACSRFGFNISAIRANHSTEG